MMLVLATIRLASGFLTYSDMPAESDAVVLFVGPGFEERQQEACRLIGECRAKYLIIPAYNVVTAVNGMQFSRIRQITDAEYASFKARKHMDYEAWYEDTHVEVMEAKRLMASQGVRSAIFVSSPYHMRRIKLISNRLFNSAGTAIRFVPSRSEAAVLRSSRVSVSAFHWQVSEYAKIVWLLLYRPFAGAA
jgi:hypothetical protein